MTCRVADELPWLLKQSGDRVALKNCILNLCVFQRLYARLVCFYGYFGFMDLFAFALGSIDSDHSDN